MATKAELETHKTEYYSRMKAALAAREVGRYREAIEWSMDSWAFVDGMMQYESKYEEREFRSVEAIDLVLKYAPPFLHLASLETLGTLLKKQKRIDKLASDDLDARLATARQKLWEAHRLWTHVEQNPNTRQDELRQRLGGDQDEWRAMAESWDHFGILLRTPEGGSYRLQLRTRMDSLVPAKCPRCGLVAKGAKGRLLLHQTCPKCHSKVQFVFLPQAETAAAPR
ncbi:MAG: hypothetical protein HYZ53_15245 [Planctomycetes bacterium]|nr:hypothetical protein [Planctomycetota bacterium]